MRKRVSKMPRSDMGFRDMGPGNMPRRPSLDFLEGRMPIKRGGFGGGFGNLREAIRRLKEERDMGMPRMEGSIGRLPGMGMIGTPQPIPERMPTDPSSYYNPTIFGQPIGDMDFSQMPEISPVDMSNLQMPTLPREISQMDIPQMPEGLPSMQDVQGMPQMGMRDMQPRMMMAEGDEVFMDSTPEQMAFSIEAEIKNLMNEYEMAANNGENERAMMLNEQINELEAQKIKIMNQGRAQLKGGGDFPDLTGDGKVTQADILKGRDVYAEGDEIKSFADYQPEGSLKGTFFDYIPDGYQVSSFLMDKFGQEAAQDPTIREMFEKEFKAARMAGKDVFEFMGKPYNTKTLEEVEGMRYGGEMERFQEGGEINAMLSGMDSGEQEAMGELEQMAPEIEMIDQLVMMVAQMIQQGAGEKEVIMFLREQGLDDEDIGTVLQLVTEMAETEEVAAQNDIGADLEQLG